MIEIRNFTRSKINKRFIKKVIAGTLHQTGISDTISVSVVFAGKERMGKLTRTYRNKGNVADVLSFREGQNFVSSPQDMNFLGEIFICPSVIKNRLKKQKHQEYAREVAHLLIHATLHLLGWEHERGEARGDAMHEKEEKIMKVIL